MIFQDPRAHINPVRRIGDFMTEALRTNHGRAGGAGAPPRGRTCSPRSASRTATRRLRQYPHQMSGGMLQRVMIAAALLTEPPPAAGRRADHRAGRHHPGRGHGDPRRPAARVRAGHAVHHPRPGAGRRHLRPYGRDVRRAGRGGPRLRAAARRPAAPLHRRARRGPAGHQRRPRAGCAPSPAARCRRSRRRRRSAPSRPAARTPGRSAGPLCPAWPSWTAGCPGAPARTNCAVSFRWHPMADGQRGAGPGGSRPAQGVRRASSPSTTSPSASAAAGRWPSSGSRVRARPRSRG